MDYRLQYTPCVSSGTGTNRAQCQCQCQCPCQCIETGARARDEVEGTWVGRLGRLVSVSNNHKRQRVPAGVRYSTLDSTVSTQQYSTVQNSLVVGVLVVEEAAVPSSWRGNVTSKLKRKSSRPGQSWSSRAVICMSVTELK